MSEKASLQKSLGKSSDFHSAHSVLSNIIVQRKAQAIESTRHGVDCPCDGGCPRCAGVIQPKLKIGQPNDIYEQEADRIAEQVMRMPEPVLQPKPT